LRVSQEADILRTLRHENIVRFIGVYFDPPNIGIVMEYCAGGSLFDQMKHWKEVIVAGDHPFRRNSVGAGWGRIPGHHDHHPIAGSGASEGHGGISAGSNGSSGLNSHKDAAEKKHVHVERYHPLRIASGIAQGMQV